MVNFPSTKFSSINLPLYHDYDICNTTFFGPKCHIINFSFKTIVALWSLWVWVEVGGLGIDESTYYNIEVVVSLLELNFVLTHESHISLNWRFQSSVTYTPRFAHATLQILGLKVPIRLWVQQYWCWWSCLHTKQLPHNLISTYLLCIAYGNERCLQYGWNWYILLCPTKQDISARKISWAPNSKGPSHSCFFFVVNMTKHTFQISKAEGTFNYEQLYYSFP